MTNKVDHPKRSFMNREASESAAFGQPYYNYYYHTATGRRESWNLAGPSGRNILILGVGLEPTTNG